MQRPPIISNQKIIFFVIFISVMLITSLFVFHLSKSPAKNQLSSDHVILFPVPREIKSFELMAANHQSFTQKNFYGHFTLLFFGFTHCSQICPTTLTLLDHVYKALNPNYPTLQVVFVSIDPERDSSDAIYRYVQSFNPMFIGTTGKIDVLHKLQSQFGIFSARDANTIDTYQINHTPSIILINPRGEWAGVFNNTITAKQLTVLLTHILTDKTNEIMRS